jgi:hypothetical protein
MKAVLLPGREINGDFRFHFVTSLLHEIPLHLVFYGVKAVQFAGKQYFDALHEQMSSISGRICLYIVLQSRCVADSVRQIETEVGSKRSECFKSSDLIWQTIHRHRQLCYTSTAFAPRPRSVWILSCISCHPGCRAYNLVGLETP